MSVSFLGTRVLCSQDLLTSFSQVAIVCPSTDGAKFYKNSQVELGMLGGDLTNATLCTASFWRRFDLKARENVKESTLWYWSV